MNFAGVTEYFLLVKVRLPSIIKLIDSDMQNHYVGSTLCVIMLLNQALVIFITDLVQNVRQEENLWCLATLMMMKYNISLVLHILD